MARQQFPSDLARSFQFLPGDLEDLASQINQSIVHEFTWEYKQKAFGTFGYTPHVGQLPIHESMRRFRLSRCGRRFGKAIDITTLIPTPDGWREMGDIQEGNFVFDGHGVATQVLWTSEILVDRPCFEVEFSDGSVIVADSEHQWWVYDKKARKGMGRNKSDVHPRVVTTHQMIDEGLSYLGKESRFAVRVTDPVQYGKSDLPLDPYLLGVWLGDGSKDCAIITTADDEIVQSFHNAGYNPKKLSSKYGWSVCGSSKGEFMGSLRELSLVRDKHIPRMYLEGSIDQRLSLLQGLMDTDGHVTKFGACEFMNTNRRLADGVFELVASLGIKPVLTEKRATLNGKDCGPAFRVTFTPDEFVFRLTRKRDRLRPANRPWTKFRYVTSIKPCLTRPVKCIAVDNPEQTYLVGRSFIPTHNSQAAAAEACAMATLPRRVIWIVAPNYELTGRVFATVWRILVHILGYKPQTGSSYSRYLLRLPNESYIQGKTLENPQGLVGEGIHLLICDEVQMMPHTAWTESLLPSISGGVQGRVMMIGTPAPGHWTNDLFDRVEATQFTQDEDPNWQIFWGPSYLNPHWYPGGEHDPDIQMLRSQMDREEFEEQILARPRRPRLQVYREWEEAAHVTTEAEFNPALDVYLGLDPGTANGYGVAVVQWDPEKRKLNVIDEYQEAGATAPDVWIELRRRPWWYKRRLAVCDDQALSDIILWCRPQSAGGGETPTISAQKTKGEVRDQAVASGLRVVKLYLRDPDVWNPLFSAGFESFASDGGFEIPKMPEDDLRDLAFKYEQIVPTWMKQQAAIIQVHPRCTTLRDQMKSYRYHQGRIEGRNIKEAPEKKNDHLLDALRYIIWQMDFANKRFGGRRAPENHLDRTMITPMSSPSLG